MAQKKTKRLPLILSAALLATALTVPAASAEEPDYILNISDKKVFNNFWSPITQEGSADLTSFMDNDSVTMDCDTTGTATSDPIKLKYTKQNSWSTTFMTAGKNFSIDMDTVVDVKFKVYLDDYKKTSPYVGLRLTSSSGYLYCDGMGSQGIQLEESEKDTIHHMRFVFAKGDEGKAVVKYSLDGAAYSEVTNTENIPENVVNWGNYVSSEELKDDATIRFYPVAIPGTGSGIDRQTELETPVNWEFYSFTAYQTNEVPDPPFVGRQYVLNISDKKLLDDTNNTVSQDGSVTVSFFGSPGATSIYSDYPREVSSAPIKVEQIKASEYKTTFKIPGESFSTDKIIVFDIRFKVSLDDYSDSPYIGVKLSHENGLINETNGMSWRGLKMTESEKDKVHTMRFVISPNGNTTNPNCAMIYYSYDGAAYTEEARSSVDLTAIENYGTGNFRIWPVAIPSRDGDDSFVISSDDGVRELPTTVNWEIYSIEGYYTNDIPLASDITTDIPEQPEPPEEGITVTERYNANTVADGEFAGYFWNVTVPTLEGRDSIKGTFTSEKGTMEREFDITTINGEGGAVFSVLLLDAPDDVTAKFE